MKENGAVIKKMERESYRIQMVLFMKVILNQIYLMEKEN